MNYFPLGRTAGLAYDFEYHAFVQKLGKWDKLDNFGQTGGWCKALG